MSDNEKILMLLEVTNSKIESMNSELNSKIDAMGTKFEAKLDAMDTKFEAKFEAMDTKFEAKFNELEARMTESERLAKFRFDFIIEEFERSDKRILGYLEDIALNETGQQAKLSLEIR